MCADEAWDDSDAQVVCRQLGFAGGTALKSNQTTTTSQRQGQEYFRGRGQGLSQGCLGLPRVASSST